MSSTVSRADVVRPIAVLVDREGLGDTLLKLPFLRAISRAYPDRPVWWIATHTTSMAREMKPFVGDMIAHVVENANITTPMGTVIRQLRTFPPFDLVFDMRTRPELILLQKTMVVVEGVARSFDPKLDIWKTADPVVREWIERNLGPLGRIQQAAHGAGDLGRILSGLPSIAARSVAALEQFEAMTRDGLVLSPDTIAALGRSERRGRHWETVALWIIALSLLGFFWLSR